MNLNDNPTIDQFGKLLQACDETAGPHLVSVDHRGEVEIALLTNPIPTTGVQEIVEASSAHDDLFITTLFERLLRKWDELVDSR